LIAFSQLRRAKRGKIVSMRDVFFTKISELSRGEALVLAAPVAAMNSASQQMLAGSLESVALGETSNMFALPFRYPMLTRYTRSLTVACHRKHTETLSSELHPQLLIAKPRRSLLSRQKHFGASSLLRDFIDGGIIQDERFLTSSKV
jgi:hypothetical protein